jgi:6-phosphogluconolactonase
MGGTVSTFSYEAARGELKIQQEISTLPADFKGEISGAEIAVHPSGRFLYASNRGHDSIAIFAIQNGMLKLVGHEPTQGKEPRGFAIDPTGTWLLAGNQKSDSLVLFRIDADTGLLKATGSPVELGAPVCVKFVPMP